VLTGKYLPDAPPPAGTRATSDEMSGFIDRWMLRPVLEAVQKLKPLAAEAGLTLGQFALAWVLKEPNVASAIIGASRPEQVEENAAASGVKVDPALFAEAERIAAEGLAQARE
jgi:aryl-alcohol dehydrogenase-like predicted oxidoreductase